MLKISQILTLFFILISIRTISVFDSLKTNLDIILRPGQNIFVVSTFSKVLFIIVAIIAMLYFVKTLRKSDCKTKNYYFLLLLFYYIISSLSQRYVYKNLTYLYVLQAFNVKISDLIPFFEQDLFFEEPYIFWFVLLMCFLFYFFKKKNCHEYIIPLFIIPYYFLNFPLNSTFVVYGITVLLISIFGMKYCKNSSAIYYHLMHFILNLLIVVYVFLASVKDNHSFLYCLEILFLYYIPSIFLIFICIKSKNNAGIASTWILPSITTLLMAMPLSKIEYNQMIVCASSSINCFLFLGNISISIGLILLASFLINKISNKITNFTFYTLSIFTIVYYGLDSILYHYSHFRINKQNILWTMKMNDIVGTTLKTCFDYVNKETWLLIVLSIIIMFFVVKKMGKFLQSHYEFKILCLTIILSSQLSSFLFSIISFIPLKELQDPFFSMLKELEIKDKSKVLTIEEILTGFKECKIPIKKLKNKNVSKGNNYNCILITLESVHWRYLDIFCKEQKSWPRMSNYKDRMVIFPYFFSCYPESTVGDIAMVSGLQVYSPDYIFSKDTFFFPTIVDELKKSNYETFIFASSSLKDGNRIGLVKTMPFDNIFSYETSIKYEEKDRWYWGFKEEKVVNEILNSINKRVNTNSYFIWYRTVCPHAPFPNLNSSDDLIFKQKSIIDEDMVISYKNNLVYLDRQFDTLVKGIDKIDKERGTNTIIVFCADHGEMLGEKNNMGLFGHGIYAPSNLTNCPLIIIYPKANGLIVNKKVGSQIDVLPTILDCLDLYPSVERFELGESLLKNQESNRPVYLSSRKDFALVENGYYYHFVDKESPNECIVEKIDIDKNFKAIFTRTDFYDKNLLLEKFNRIKKYFKLQEDFIQYY